MSRRMSMILFMSILLVTSPAMAIGEWESTIAQEHEGSNRLVINLINLSIGKSHTDAQASVTTEQYMKMEQNLKVTTEQISLQSDVQIETEASVEAGIKQPSREPDEKNRTEEPEPGQEEPNQEEPRHKKPQHDHPYQKNPNESSEEPREEELSNDPNQRENTNPDQGEHPHDSDSSPSPSDETNGESPSEEQAHSNPSKQESLPKTGTWLNSLFWYSLGGFFLITGASLYARARTLGAE